MPSIWGATDQQIRNYGILPGTKAVGIFGNVLVFGWADKRSKPAEGYPEGETEEGIVIDRHPDAMLLEHPALWRIVNLWRSPISKELSYELFKTFTHKEKMAWTELYQTWLRHKK